MVAGETGENGAYVLRLVGLENKVVTGNVIYQLHRMVGESVKVLHRNNGRVILRHA